MNFAAHNVVEDEGVLDEMEAMGLPRRVPIVQCGEDWEDTRFLEAVARIAGIEHEADPLPVEDLFDRLEVILTAARRYVELLDDEDLRTDIPNRPRSVGGLYYHIFDIPEIFLEHEDGTPLTSFDPEPEWANWLTAALTTHAEHVLARLHDSREGRAGTGLVGNCQRLLRRAHRPRVPRADDLAQRPTRAPAGVDADGDVRPRTRPGRPVCLGGLPLPEKVWDATP